MLSPKKVKHRKWHKGHSRTNLTKSGSKLSFGSFGLKAEDGYWLTSRQIESARRAITRYVQRGGKLWIRVFPDKPRTIKGVEVPMGGGAGKLDHYVAPIKPGKIIFEIDGVTEKMAIEAMRLAGHKLPIKTRFVKR